MAPVILECQKTFKCVVGLSGQHTDMVHSFLKSFGVSWDYDLNIQNEIKDIEDPLVLLLKKLKKTVALHNPDLILVHGDTSTTLAGALGGFYNKIPVAHVEAGLRSHNIQHPWPEEANRKMVSTVAQINFAPTLKAVKNLRDENVAASSIIHTGNTVIDAVRKALDLIKNDADLTTELTALSDQFDKEKKWVILTGHRKENLGAGINEVFKAAIELSLRSDTEVIFPVHPNPKVRESIQELLGTNHNVKLVKPFSYFEMIWMLSKSTLLITDSGGLQEEAPFFGIPTLVTRLTTERSEAIENGSAFLVGTDKEKILSHALAVLNKEINIQPSFPFGDGYASLRIKKFLDLYLSYDLQTRNELFERITHYFDLVTQEIKPGELGQTEPPTIDI